VQAYVRRGLLEAQEEGKGAHKRFLVFIDSLNTMLERRRGEASETAKFAGASAGSEEAANLVANDREGLRHVIDCLEARTAEATELRIRLELTERAESTLRADLEEARRRREQAERERDELAAELAALQEARDAHQTDAEEPEHTDAPNTSGVPQQEAAERRSWWRRLLDG
jgi:chromosome condensin MukBEF ATPase and DNA-binding subunit MukB